MVQTLKLVVVHTGKIDYIRVWFGLVCCVFFHKAFLGCGLPLFLTLNVQTREKQC